MAPLMAHPLAAAARTGLITPAESHAEMRRLGWRAVASVYRGQPQHVIEYLDDDTSNAETFEPRRRLSGRVHQSGDDFWKRTSRYLYDFGLREDVGLTVSPQKTGGVRVPAGRSRALE